MGDGCSESPRNSCGREPAGRRESQHWNSSRGKRTRICNFTCSLVRWPLMSGVEVRPLQSSTADRADPICVSGAGARERFAAT